MSNHTMNKAQSELIGLAMVVFLIIVGLLIFVSFSLSSTSKDFSYEHQIERLPVLLNDAILESNVGDGCYNEKIKTLLLKYGQRENFYCPNNNDPQPVGVYVEEQIEYILNETLDSWFMTYRYRVYTGLNYANETAKVLYLSNYDTDNDPTNDCLRSSIKTENFFFSMPTGDFLNMKLDICYD